MATGATDMEAGAGTAIGATGTAAAGLAMDTHGAAAAVAGAVVEAITGAAADDTGLCTERETYGKCGPATRWEPTLAIGEHVRMRMSSECSSSCETETV